MQKRYAWRFWMMFLATVGLAVMAACSFNWPPVMGGDVSPTGDVGHVQVTTAHPPTNPSAPGHQTAPPSGGETVGATPASQTAIDEPATPSGEKLFTVFDSMSYAGKPDMAKYWLKPIRAVSRGLGTDGQLRATARLLARQQTALIFMDVENIKLTGDDPTVQQGVARYIRMADVLHDQDPGLRLGFYGVPPLRDYWNAVKGPDATSYQKWAQDNARIAPIARHVDVVFPSLYTFYDDPAGWKKYAVANLDQAHQYGKMVYVFLWPRYHDSNKKIGGQLIPGKDWRAELETCYAHADGIVIWDGDPKIKWNENWPWWQETVKFLREKGISPPPIQ